TIDATAFRACKAAGLIDSGHQILHPGDKKHDKLFSDFMEVNHLPYDPRAWSSDADDEGDFRNVPYGNQLISLNNYLTCTMRAPSSWLEYASQLGITIPAIVYSVPALLEKWGDYKQEHGVYEHADYVRLALDEQASPPASLLIVDEYQDVSPLQNALIRLWIDHPDTQKVYLAGDEDQSIYGFRGCDPSLFLDISAQDLATGGADRPTSHRCPVRVLQAAEKILCKLSNVSPLPDRQGTVSHISCDNSDVLSHLIEEGAARLEEKKYSHLFILSRFRYSTWQIAKALSNHGIPCSGIKEGRIRYWTKVSIPSPKTKGKQSTVHINLFTLKRAIQKYLSSSDTPVPLEEAVTLVLSLTSLTGTTHDEAISDLHKRERAVSFLRKVGDNNISADNLHILTGGRRDDILDLLALPNRQVEQIRLCLNREKRRGFEITPEMIRIDTIHAAKGLEAPITLLHTGYLENRLESLGLHSSLAEERRIYFVGATRASRTLIFLEFGKMPALPLIQGAWL
ncbi:MAG: ATP-dependent helicase, partial [Spirochaetia bacterium]|nr:ATP-dependent helicase [Spirochaetia bacterium]